MLILDNATGTYQDVLTLYEPSTLLEYIPWKIEKLFQSCSTEIYQGFTSVSTGHNFLFNLDYQNNFTQQLALLGVDSTILSVYFNTSDAGLIQFTRDEFITICKEAKQHKEDKLLKYFQLKAQVQNSTSIEQAKLINW